jgi:hypothetical protein
MLLPLGELVFNAGDVLELEARHPLSPPAAPLMRGRRAGGCGVANSDEGEDEGERGEENDDEGQAERGGGS